jgi:hypothetical protein
LSNREHILPEIKRRREAYDSYLAVPVGSPSGGWHPGPDQLHAKKKETAHLDEAMLV